MRYIIFRKKKVYQGVISKEGSFIFVYTQKRPLSTKFAAMNERHAWNSASI